MFKRTLLILGAVLVLPLVVLGVFLCGLSPVLATPSTRLSDLSPQWPHQPAAPEALPDLSIESFTMTPPNPQLYEPVTFTVKACNIGDETAFGRRVYLYIDPADTPPLSTTQETYRLIVMGIDWPPGDANCVTAYYSNFTFGQSGSHAAYAWVDPYEVREESNEVNNLNELQIEVQPDVPVNTQDAYEDDDACNQGKVIPTDASIQKRNFYSADEEKDVDWVKLSQVTQGEVYTVTVASTGEDARPVVEVWDSCTVPPRDFGGTSYKVVWSPTRDGDYYLKIQNDGSEYDPAKTDYQLFVQGPTAVVTGTQSEINGITPAEGRNDVDTHVVITGTNFSVQTKPALCPYEGRACGACTYVLENTNVAGDASSIFAVVPKYFPPGAYCLSVNTPDGQVTTFPNAFTVRAGLPTLQGVQPHQGYVSQTTDLNVRGLNFHPGISIALGTTPLINLVVFNQTNLRATLPVSLPAGAYTMTAFYPGADVDSLPNAYVVLAGDEDLFAQGGELWVDPAAPRANASVDLGVFVHRKSSNDESGPLLDVPVRFWINNELLGDTYVPPLPNNEEMSTWRLTWTPTQAGDYVIKAEIDPENKFVESQEDNNVVTRTLTVLTPAADKVAPHVDMLTIKDSNEDMDTVETVTDTLVFLDTDAVDYPQPGGVGVSHLRYIEFEYNQGAQLWVPVQDSGWVISDVVNSTNYRWQLSPVGGLHYIQGWAKDGAGNISRYPYQQRVNYVKPKEWVGRNQVRIYRQTLAVGDTLDVVLTPLMGDADLYIWPPDWKDGRPPWVSNKEGQDVEEFNISAPVAGVYQIEIYGYNAAQYELDIEVQTAGKAQQATPRQQTPPRRPSGRHWPLAPVIPITAEPPLQPSVDLIGSSEGMVNRPYAFGAMVMPSSVALPITYTWAATDQPASEPYSLTNLMSVFTYTWDTVGAKTVTVTATTGDGIAEATHTITITDAPVVISGLGAGETGITYTFRAELAFTPTVGLPLTYTWEALEQPRVVYASVISRSATVDYNWPDPGRKMITVTISNARETFWDTHQIEITEPEQHLIYLPLVLRVSGS